MRSARAGQDELRTVIRNEQEILARRETGGAGRSTAASAEWNMGETQRGTRAQSFFFSSRKHLVACQVALHFMMAGRKNNNDESSQNEAKTRV